MSMNIHQLSRTIMWPNRLLFGEGSARETGPEAARFSNGPVLVVTDPGVMEAGLLGDEEPDGLGHVIHFAQPGTVALTVMPYSPYRLTTLRVKPSTLALDAPPFSPVCEREKGSKKAKAPVREPEPSPYIREGNYF